MTLLGAIQELWRHRGRYDLLKFQWGQFNATLKKENVKHNVSWNKPETVVSSFSAFINIISGSFSCLDYLVCIGTPIASVVTFSLVTGSHLSSVVSPSYPCRHVLSQALGVVFIGLRDPWWWRPRLGGDLGWRVHEVCLQLRWNWLSRVPILWNFCSVSNSQLFFVVCQVVLSEWWFSFVISNCWMFILVMESALIKWRVYIWCIPFVNQQSVNRCVLQDGPLTSVEYMVWTLKTAKQDDWLLSSFY